MAVNSDHPPARNIPIAEANDQMNDVVETVATGAGDVILEQDGAPRAAIISMEEYRHLLAVREQERKDAALRWLREFQESYDGRNDDLLEDEIMALAVRATKEARAELWEEDRQRRTGSRPSGQPEE